MFIIPLSIELTRLILIIIPISQLRPLQVENPPYERTDQSFQCHALNCYTWPPPFNKTQKGCSPPQKPPLLPASWGSFQKTDNSRKLFICRLIQAHFSIRSLENGFKHSFPRTRLVLTHKLWSPTGARREAQPVTLPPVSPQTHKQGASDLLGFSLLVPRAVNLLPGGSIWQLPKVLWSTLFKVKFSIKSTWNRFGLDPGTDLAPLCPQAAVGYTSLPGFFESSGADYVFSFNKTVI